MNKEAKIVKKLYAGNVKKEWNRLAKNPFHELEYNTTLSFLKKYLPSKGLILDAGGGPGRYSIELAKLGYNIKLLDLVPENLELAIKKIKQAKIQSKIKEIVEGSITDLSPYKDNSFDAVLCLGGPLSHVHPEANRKKAISELIRVAKKNAPIFVSVMGKIGTLMVGPYSFADEIKMEKHFKRIYSEGNDYYWYSGTGNVVAFSHYFELDELKELFPKDKTKFITQLGLEGMASSHEKDINKLAKKEPKAWKNWLEMHDKLCTKPTVADLSQHFMVIVRKK